ncbi:helix-turn-helix domain-containing protein [Streptomyces sp. NPDC056713]|uniref:helix-turn-helix domain-containing protein n=1 Tax=Streptomyces sp. NPDC056713 TaxID=3345921 RepID=UPI00367FAC43
MSDRVRLSGQLIEARLSANLSMRELGDLSDVDTSSISRFEDAQRLPSRETLQTLVFALREAGARISWDLMSEIYDRASLEPDKELVNAVYAIGTETGEPALANVTDVPGFVEALRELHVWAGKPSMRELQRRSMISKSTFSKLLTEDRLPTFSILMAFLQACNAQYREAWVRKWRHLSRAQVPAPTQRGTA